MFELKGYIERELRENEIIIWNSGMSRFVLYLYYAILFIAFVALTLSAINLIPMSPEAANGSSWFIVLNISLAFILISSYWILQFHTTEFSVTSLRVISKVGWISRDIKEIKVGAVESYDINEGFIQRLLGIGNIVIRGRGQGEVILDAIDDTSSIRKILEDNIPI